MSSEEKTPGYTIPPRVSGGGGASSRHMAVEEVSRIVWLCCDPRFVFRNYYCSRAHVDESHNALVSLQGQPFCCATLWYAVSCRSLFLHAIVNSSVLL